MLRPGEALRWLWAHRWAAVAALASVALVLVGALVGRRRKPARTPPTHPAEREEGRREGAAAAYEEQAAAAGERAAALEQEAAPRPAEPVPKNVEEMSDADLSDLFNSRTR